MEANEIEKPARLAIAAMEACESLDPSFVRGEYLGLSSTQPNN